MYEVKGALAIAPALPAFPPSMEVKKYTCVIVFHIEYFL